MAEWPNAVVLKTIEPKGSEGSNPSLSATVFWVFCLEAFFVQQVADYILNLRPQLVTKKHYRRDIKGAFTRWIEQGWTVDNP